MSLKRGLPGLIPPHPAKKRMSHKFESQASARQKVIEGAYVGAF